MTVTSKTPYVPTGNSWKDFHHLLKTKDIATLADMPEFVDEPDTTMPFKAHYDQFVRPHVETFEAKRVAMLTEFRRRGVVAAPLIKLGLKLALALFITLFLADIVMVGLLKLSPMSDTAGILLFILIIGIIAGVVTLAIWLEKPVKEYKSSIKSTVFPEIFRFFGDGFSYVETPPITIESLKPSGIIPSHDKARIEDYVKGSYNGVQLELMEAKLTERRGGEKNSRTVTVFDGVCVLLSMNKAFKGRTMVKKDEGGAANAVGGWISKKFDNVQRVKLEDPVFEKQFEVYGTDQVEARYLLTTSFMERLLGVAALFGKGVQAGFYDDHLLLMLPSKKDRFEPASIFTPATFVEDSKTILTEMQAIFGIIDALKLHERTGL
jgi:hypothetical protein